MIVVVGSRHDSVATRLVARWPGAALCAAEDLTRGGWVWRHAHPASRRWVVGGQRVRDADISGVFLRRSAVYAQELVGTHADDRDFLAAEAHAFLTCVLASTSARVINPVVDGAFGEEALRPEHCAEAAVRLGIPLVPVRVSSHPRRYRRARTHEVEVVAGESFGAAPERVHVRARELAREMRLCWVVTVFDARQRLLALTQARAPSDEASDVLGRVLAAGGA